MPQAGNQKEDRHCRIAVRLSSVQFQKHSPQQTRDSGSPKRGMKRVGRLTQRRKRVGTRQPTDPRSTEYY